METEQAAFGSCHDYSYKYDKKEANDIQTVILDPVQVMSSRPEMLRSFVSHNKLSPEHSQVQWLYETVPVH